SKNRRRLGRCCGPTLRRRCFRLCTASLLRLLVEIAAVNGNLHRLGNGRDDMRAIRQHDIHVLGLDGHTRAGDATHHGADHGALGVLGQDLTDHRGCGGADANLLGVPHVDGMFVILIVLQGVVGGVMRECLPTTTSLNCPFGTSPTISYPMDSTYSYTAPSPILPALSHSLAAAAQHVDAHGSTECNSPIKVHPQTTTSSAQETAAVWKRTSP